MRTMNIEDFAPIRARGLVLTARQQLGDGQSLLPTSAPRFRERIDERLRQIHLLQRLRDTGETVRLVPGVDYGFVAYTPNLGGTAWDMRCFGCDKRRRALYILHDRKLMQCALCLGLHRRRGRRAAALDRAVRALGDFKYFMARAENAPLDPVLRTVLDKATGSDRPAGSTEAAVAECASA